MNEARIDGCRLVPTRFVHLSRFVYSVPCLCTTCLFLGGVNRCLKKNGSRGKLAHLALVRCFPASGAAGGVTHLACSCFSVFAAGFPLGLAHSFPAVAGCALFAAPTGGNRARRGSELRSRVKWSITFALEGDFAILALAGKETPPLYHLCSVGIHEEGVPHRLNRLVDILGETFGVTAVLIEEEIAERFAVDGEALSAEVLAEAGRVTQRRTSP